MEDGGGIRSRRPLRCSRRDSRDRNLDSQLDSQVIMRSQTRFIRAVAQSRLKEVESILRHGFNVNFQSPRTNGFTALHCASQNGDIKLVAILLGHGAVVDLSTDMGVTALMLAADLGHTAVVKLLLNAHAEIDRQEPTYGASALMMAASQGHTATVIALREAHASEAIVGQCLWHGKTAVTLAMEGEHVETARSLAQRVPEGQMTQEVPESNMIPTCTPVAAALKTSTTRNPWLVVLPLAIFTAMVFRSVQTIHQRATRQ